MTRLLAGWDQPVRRAERVAHVRAGTFPGRSPWWSRAGRLDNRGVVMFNTCREAGLRPVSNLETLA